MMADQRSRRTGADDDYVQQYQKYLEKCSDDTGKNDVQIRHIRNSDHDGVEKYDRTTGCWTDDRGHQSTSDSRSSRDWTDKNDFADERCASDQSLGGRSRRSRDVVGLHSPGVTTAFSATTRSTEINGRNADRSYESMLAVADAGRRTATVQRSASEMKRRSGCAIDPIDVSSVPVPSSISCGGVRSSAVVSARDDGTSCDRRETRDAKFLTTNQPVNCRPWNSGGQQFFRQTSSRDSDDLVSSCDLESTSSVVCAAQRQRRISTSDRETQTTVYSGRQQKRHGASGNSSNVVLGRVNDCWLLLDSVDALGSEVDGGSYIPFPTTFEPWDAIGPADILPPASAEVRKSSAAAETSSSGAAAAEAAGEANAGDRRRRRRDFATQTFGQLAVDDTQSTVDHRDVSSQTEGLSFDVDRRHMRRRSEKGENRLAENRDVEVVNGTRPKDKTSGDSNVVPDLTAADRKQLMAKSSRDGQKQGKTDQAKIRGSGSRTGDRSVTADRVVIGDGSSSAVKELMQLMIDEIRHLQFRADELNRMTCGGEAERVAENGASRLQHQQPQQQQRLPQDVAESEDSAIESSDFDEDDADDDDYVSRWIKNNRRLSRYARRRLALMYRNSTTDTARGPASGKRSMGQGRASNRDVCRHRERSYRVACSDGNAVQFHGPSSRCDEQRIQRHHAPLFPRESEYDEWPTTNCLHAPTSTTPWPRSIAQQAPASGYGVAYDSIQPPPGDLTPRRGSLYPFQAPYHDRRTAANPAFGTFRQPLPVNVDAPVPRWLDQARPNMGQVEFVGATNVANFPFDANGQRSTGLMYQAPTVSHQHPVGAMVDYSYHWMPAPSTVAFQSPPKTATSATQWLQHQAPVRPTTPFDVSRVVFVPLQHQQHYT